ncbi:MAG: DinB family protein [Acidobacteriota bacterium]
MTLKKISLSICPFVVSVIAVITASAQLTDTIGTLKFFYGYNKRNIVASAEKMSEANYTFKPSPDIRSFGEVLGHITDVNYLTCAAMKGEANPSKDPVEKTAKTKDDFIKALKASYDYCDGAFANLSEALMKETYKVEDRVNPKAGMVILNTQHGMEHYGNLVIYLRMKGIVPPTTERAQQQQAPPAPKADQSNPPQFDLETYQLGLLRKGPNHGSGTKEEAEKIQAGHMANIGKMAQAGKLIAAGPMGDDGDLRGIFLFKVASLDEAKALAAEDPAIKAGRLKLELFNWMGPKGIGAKLNEEYRKDPAIKMTMTKYHFALLRRVPNSTVGSSPEDQKLLLDHLWGIRRMMDEGKMPAAGPVGDAGDLAGIFVFATESLDEAKAWVNTDPMVRAGRMTAEIHPWYVAKEVWGK